MNEREEYSELLRFRKKKKEHQAKINKRAAELYDRLICLLPKEERERFEAQKESRGFSSTSDYLKALIYEDMERSKK